MANGFNKQLSIADSNRSFNEVATECGSKVGWNGGPIETGDAMVGSGLLTVKEVAEKLRLSITSVYGLIRRGMLAAIRIGGRKGAIRVFQDEVQRYLDESISCPAMPEPVIPSRPLKHIRLSKHQSKP
jgi:excisionase family DNA binding protein